MHHFAWLLGREQREAGIRSRFVIYAFGLEIALYPRLVSNSWQSCLSLLRYYRHGSPELLSFIRFGSHEVQDGLRLPVQLRILLPPPPQYWD